MTLALAIAVVLLTLGGLYARARVAQMAARERHRANFFAAADVLADRPETPESVLAVIEFLAHRVGERRAPYVLLYLLLHGDLRRTAGEPRAKLRQLRADIRTMPPDLVEQFGDAVAAAGMAISLNSLAVGWLIRRVAMLRVHSRDARHYTGTDDADTLMSGWACA